ncbi:IMPACT family protein [Algoriphagus limi]|uniref:YigZ family protein n=1 Tax=Algoriphagus limi TaxID=2975273 RepID=A0ABT2G4C8_9BACT|nr:YigZ family protein [Algoriphagus limi]MCS5490119.1 YigZ family protein [Algoriphagus limi]
MSSSVSENDSFLTLSRESSGLFKEKNSKFHYFAFPVKNEDEIKAQLEGLRKKFYDARHHCYAYSLGKDGEIFRANDDGEPNHSAGDPILGQIRSFGLTNVLIVVVRYFGGTKLGMSGLIQAYKTSARLSIEENEIVEDFLRSRVQVKFPYSQMNEVMKLIKNENLEIESQEMALDAEMVLVFRSGLLEKVSEELEQMDGVDFKLLE